MLYILLMLILLLPVLAGWGRIFSLFFGEVFCGISGLLFSGVFISSALFTVLAFFLPINTTIEIGTIAIGLAAFFWFKLYIDFWRFFSSTSLGFYLFLALAALFGASYPFILDHFGYYLPSIKWLTEFGLVKGISNLDLLLGQMSVWHIFQAGFSHFADPFLRINVLAAAFYLIYIFEKKEWLHLLFLPILFFFLQSPSPDFPAIAFSLVLLNEVLRENTNLGLLFVFSVFVFALKPTVVWLPLFVLLYGIFIVRSNLKFIIGGALFFLVFAFKNIWTFGFPLFPAAFFDFNIPWKPNAEILKESASVAIRKTYDLRFSIEEIQQFSGLDYVVNWFSFNGIKSIINLFFIFCIFAFFVYAWKKNSKVIWVLFIAVFLKSVFVLLFSAQYRFFLDVFFVMTFVVFQNYIHKKFILLLSFVLLMVSSGLLFFPKILQNTVPSFKLGYFMGGFTKSQLVSPAYYKLKKYNSHQIGNLKFNVVQGYPFSFDTPLPAVSPVFLKFDYAAGIIPEYKGESAKDGFIWRKMTAEEAQTLKKIVQEFSNTELGN